MLSVSHIEAVPEKEQEALTGDLSELLEQVEEMYKPFLVSPKVVSKDSESGKPQPWRSRRLEAEKEKENSGSPQAARVKNINIAELDDDSPPGWQEIDNLRQCIQNIMFNP
jgi:signal transduction histidine kinase